jgi:uncharacterized protein (TIGR02246 family)
MTDTAAETGVRTLYRRILEAWNARDASAMASCFEPEGNMVGFDGSQMDSRAEITRHLKPIFASHPTAAYVAKVRQVRRLASEIWILRAVAGMIPPGSSDIKPEINTIHSLVAARHAHGWLASLFQSTPAAWHGRPADSAALTDELRTIARRGVTLE